MPNKCLQGGMALKDRIILHCDLNNFFASVSLLFNPTLKNLPVAVCGDKENRHGIVLAKNELAKQFGVKTAEPIFAAVKKCPDLVMLPPIYDQYEEYSKKAHAIYTRYTDMIEPFGIDECWLDVTGSTVLFGNGEEIAHKIKDAIRSELGITASVGVSFNKIFAKLGSDMKKPDAVTVIHRDDVAQKVWPLPISDLLFVGKKTAEKLHRCGIHTIGDLTLCEDSLLKKLCGKNGIDLKNYALGNDFSPVVTPTENSKPKSVGKSVTTNKDFTSDEEVWRAFLSFSQSICDTLREKGLYAGGVGVHIRTAALKTFEFSQTHRVATNCAITLAQWGFSLFQENYTFGEPLRSVGIRAINLRADCRADQMDIFSDEGRQEKIEMVEDSLYNLRQKFGKDSLKRGRNI